jgi:predicted transposase/invertase (TIGR01784 family)
MTNKLIKKHEEISKKFLTDIHNAKLFLKFHLDPKILAKCDVNSLAIEPNSYLDNDLRKRFSDIVYKLDLQNKLSNVYVYILIEHQSVAQKLMPVRILRYQLEIIQNHIDKYKVEDNLPLVVPLVFYNGDVSPYPYATDIKDLFADKELINDVYLGKFKLVDLTIMPEDEILQHQQLAIMEMCLKHIQARDFSNIIMEYILKAILVAHDSNLSKNLFDSAISYIMNAREGIELQPLFKQIIEHISEYEDDIMTYAEELRQEGMQKGRQEGMQEGIHEGMQKGMHQMAKELLKSGVDESLIAKASHLSQKELDEIKKSLH